MSIMKTHIGPKVLTLLGLLPWLAYFIDVASQGYPQFGVLPLFAFFPAPLRTVRTGTPEAYATGVVVGAVLLLLGLGGVALRRRRLALIAALAFDVCMLLLVIAVCIRHEYEKV